MAATAMTSVTTDAPSSTSPTTISTSPTSITPTPTLPISMPTTASSPATATSSPSTAHLSLEERFPFLREQTGRRRSRQLLSPEQTNVLLGILRQTRFPSTAVREQAAKELGISPRKVQVFFQNKRQGLRKKMLNAAQDLVDLANSEDTSHDAPAPIKTPAGAQLQARQRRAMTLGGGRLPARISSPAGAKQAISPVESRTYDAWRLGGATADDDGMEVDGEESEDGSPDEGEGDDGETHDDVGEEPMTPTPARLAAMQARPLAAITATQQVAPAPRQRAASDAAYLQQRGAAHAVAPRPQHSPIQQQRPQAHPYARPSPSPRSATLLPPLQMSPRNGQAGTRTPAGALTSSASPRRAAFSFAGAAPGARTMPAPTRALPMLNGMTSRPPVGTVTSPPGAVVLGLSNMAPRHPPPQQQHQHQPRPHDAARHHQRSISLAAYPMMTGPGPALQHQHHLHTARVPLQPLAPQPQPQPQPVPRQQQQQVSPLHPARPTSLRRHASYGHPDAHAQQPTAAPVAVTSLPFMQWRSGSGDQSYASSFAGTTMDGMTMGTTTMTHPSSETGSSDMDVAWTPSSTRDDGLASKEGQRVISPRHAHAVATPSRRMHAPLPHQWMQHAHPTTHANAGAAAGAMGRARGLSTTRKPISLAPILDLSLDVPLDVERLGSRSPEQPRKRLNGSEQDQEEQEVASMTLPPLRLGARPEEGMGLKRRRGAEGGNEEGSEGQDDDDAPLSKTCARAAAHQQQQQVASLPSVAELTRTLGLLPWTTKAAPASAAAKSVDAASTAVA